MDEKDKKLSGPHQPHDTFFQTIMSSPKVARDFCKNYLPKQLLKEIDLHQLDLQPKIHIDELGSRHVSDLVYKTKITGKEAYLYLVVEHQSYHDPLLAFRVLKYTIQVMDQHVKKSKNKNLPLVYPCVIYHGKNPCRLEADIRKLIDAPKELIDNYFLQPFDLVDLTQKEDQELAQHQWAGLMGLALKATYLSNALPILRAVSEAYKDCSDSRSQKNPRQFAVI